MRKKKKKSAAEIREEMTTRKAKIDAQYAKTQELAKQAEEEEIYSSQPIYNIFNFFIGGPNRAKIKNKQKGKPNVPPY